VPGTPVATSDIVILLRISLSRHLRRLADIVIVAAALAAPVATSAGQNGGSRAPNAPKGRSSTSARPTARATTRPKTTRRPIARRTAPPPALRYTAPASAAALASDIGTFLNARVRSGNWGAMIVSLTRGDTLYSANPGNLLLPASTMKLFTSALAFDTFGPEHQFTTTVLSDGALGSDGTLTGNLVLRGGGDPGLSNRFYRAPAEGPMSTLARMVAGAGIKRVSGDLIADGSAFESKRVPDGWLARYLESGYAARVSALSMNENLATVVITPQPNGGAAIVNLDPPSSTVPVVNNARTVAGSKGEKLVIRRLADGRIDVRGWIGSKAGARSYLVVIDDPALWVAGSLRSALAAQGVTVTGTVRAGAAGQSAVTVASLSSPPLTRLASAMNRESINHFAELLFRDVAHVASPDHIGSAEYGNTALRKFMAEKVGATATDVMAADGSGLSTLDRVTARALVQLLSYAHHSSWSADFHASLPVAGESELLRHRMKYTPAQGNLHAKTGTTNDVIGLAGYVTARDGEVLAFAFLYNGRDRWNAKDAIDVSGATLAGFVRQ
jgi:D-alanyl-D-alanine carboxypeptidase/D-alanyl-D-alanine-endopeptidase (penicillin-binding protein 4)